MESLPAELAGVADRVTVVLPWGSLLAAVAKPTESLREVRGVCRSGATLTVVLSVDPARDRSELERLGIADMTKPGWSERLAAGYARAGFVVRAVRTREPRDLAAWPSTWAKKLARAAGRRVVEIEATAAAAHDPDPGGP